jgi:hypothetical protein
MLNGIEKRRTLKARWWAEEWGSDHPDETKLLLNLEIQIQKIKYFVFHLQRDSGAQRNRSERIKAWGEIDLWAHLLELDSWFFERLFGDRFGKTLAVCKSAR